MNYLGFNWISVLLIAFTYFLVVTDKAFLRRIRREVQVALLLCLILSILDSRIFNDTISAFAALERIDHEFEALVRPIILALIVAAAIPYREKIDFYEFVPLLINPILILCGLGQLCFVSSCIYGGALVYLLLNRKTRREKSDVFLAVIFTVTFILSFTIEKMYNNETIVDNCLTAITCISYFYLIMKIYKRDRLTGLMLRHNLIFELEDNQNKSYDLALIDVDNFKLINDKYGHDKGDEALVTVVSTTVDYLPKSCQMYRYGGDEFVIISKKISMEELNAAIDEANSALSEDNLRMSYGIIHHNPGDEYSNTIAEADKAMYENKRLIKSEDIWDDMTGLFNMRGFLDELEIFRKSVAKDQHNVCLVGVDVERLSNINKAYGYTEGNLIITVLAKTLRSSLRGKDFIGHLGSDEFVAALECESDEDEVITTFISELQEMVDNSFELSSKEYSVKLNIDKFFIDRTEKESAEELVNNLLYIKQEEKDNRRKNDLSEANTEYNEEEDAVVQDIINNNKLQYAFQPIVSAKDGSILAYESLMRSDTDTMVSPLTILKYADLSKRSYDIHKLTMFNTLKKFSECTELGNDIKIYINAIPGHLLSDVDFDILKNKYGSLFERMVIEITEQRDIDDDSLVLLSTRREKGGFSLAIDDYGSGCSNTNNLLRYMPQVVKIDRLLIAGIDRNAKKQFFVNSIISFAKENDMLTLAEGVETEHELKTVVKLGVDMVQGYIAAKPSIDIITEIPENIRKIIVKENLKSSNGQKMIYTASDNSDLSVVSLAMEDYSQINVSADNLTISGSNEYTADMIIKIMDNVDCRLTLSNVRLNSVDDRPCIEVGDNCHLTLKVEGSTKLNAKGIYVPESSSITVGGSGTLQINAKGHECYAIGSDTQTPFGNITLNSSGLININVDGEECVAIGGGIVSDNSAISLMRGTVNLSVAGVNAVGIGAHKGSVPIVIKDTELISVFRANSGTVIGTLNGNQNVETKNFTFDFSGSGTDIAVIGNPSVTTGKITLYSGSIKSKYSGHNVYFIGGKSGDVNIDISHCGVSFLGEGDNVNGFGTMNKEATLSIKESSVDLTINASSPLAIGTKEKEILYIGPGKSFNINGVEQDIYEY